MPEAQSILPDQERAQRPNILNAYIPLVHFLGEAIGPNCELVLHDLDVPDHSIVAIANGHISGRQIGGPVTDFALRFMRQGSKSNATSMTGYRAVNAEGRICRSSSYFIRDEDGTLRGMLCINVDITELEVARDNLTKFLGDGEVQPKTTSYPDKLEAIRNLFPEQQEAPAEETPAAEETSGQGDEMLESLRSSLQSLLDSMLDTAVAKQSVAPDRMQSAERIEVVADLDEAGFFLLKGGIAAAAKRLQVSEPTIYRYLVKARA
ncbi:helix-turn-helix transcriptional regulator [Corynebacterium sp. H130]|uniref:helix-turn-helix transcriptional regulator n=1 Tax=Corynebacterium sp. H130 TaxID=3133444 RepID=UPI0030A2DEC1